MVAVCRVEGLMRLENALSRVQSHLIFSKIKHGWSPSSVLSYKLNLRVFLTGSIVPMLTYSYHAIRFTVTGSPMASGCVLPIL